jgi:hypothetical protein
MTIDDETIPAHKRAALWVFDQLLREGVIAYTPLMNVEGVDAVIRCEDGTYRDILIRASTNEHHPTWFSVRHLKPRPNLFVLCVAWALTPPQVWVLPSEEYARAAASFGNSTDLDLEVDAGDGQKLKQKLSRFRNAWRLLTDGAMRPFGP